MKFTPCHNASVALALLAGFVFSVHAASPKKTATTTLPKAVATFESLGLYWTPPSNPGSAGCTVQYKKISESAWKDGLAMWYDARNRECRGSLVRLTPGTSYDLRFGMPGQPPSATLRANTWNETFPIAKTVNLPPGTMTQTLAITQGGSASGYVLYTVESGAQTTIDVGNNAAHNITISAPFVIVRGLTLKGAAQDAIRLLNGARDVVIEGNDISGWGSKRATLSNGLEVGVDYQAGIRCESVASLERVVIQGNRIHSPRYGANSWSFGHPMGPQGITFNFCGGNHVIRYNEITGSDGHYFNDGIGGSDNFTETGFPNYDSDIYGNLITHAWDDAIEAEGGNRNVRIWGNYFNNTTTGVATTVTHWGPVYIFRNVYNRSRQLSEVPLDADDRNVFAKSGTSSKYGNGRRYIFHNTLLQAAPPPGTTYPLGAGGGVGAAGLSVTNTVTRNNIFHIWKVWWSVLDVGSGSGNDFDYDLYNGNIPSGAETHGMVGTPIYQTGNGPTSEARGCYQLAPLSPGYDRGVRLPNFNDGDLTLGAAPDIGAHETGAPPMRFGIGAAAGSCAAQ